MATRAAEAAPGSSLLQAQHRLQIATRGQGLIEVTGAVLAWTAAQGIGTGLLTVWCPHTSASLTVQENADPSVRSDILRFFAALVPEDGRYDHADEGQDDMPAHLRAMLTQVQLTIPVAAGRPVLGTWQGLYLFEHRRQPHRRDLVLHLMGTQAPCPAGPATVPPDAALTGSGAARQDG